MIRKIDGGSIKSLAAAQVILDLSSAIKELIENALDAKANSITITFNNFGLGYFEVLDDGKGIGKEDLSKIGKRNYTSKIKNDEDIFNVRTFGFRGEALHSIVAISELMTLTSKSRSSSCANDPLGYKVELSSANGYGDETEEHLVINACACQPGTRIRVNGFLHTLPVRQAEWKRNAQRNFAKAVFIVQNYCVAQPGKRFRLVHENNGKQNILLASNGSGDPKNAFAEVFKGDMKGQLLKISSEKGIFSWEIYCSPPKMGSTRRLADRQFFFVNDRPCDLPKLMKRFNLVAKEHFLDGFPILLIYLTVMGEVDVNVTPDKRMIFLRDEDSLIEESFGTLLSEQTILNAGIDPLVKRVKRGAEVAPSFPSPSQVPQSPQSSQTVDSVQSYRVELAVDPKSEELPIPLFITSDQCCTPSLRSPPVIFSPPPPPLVSPQGLVHHKLDLLPSIRQLIGEEVDEECGQLFCLKKSMFPSMEILGQFNCGFILARLVTEDDHTLLFIVDQHAADERYRLEMLIAKMEEQNGDSRLAIHSQRLLSPMCISLSLQDYLYFHSHQGQFTILGYLFDSAPADENVTEEEALSKEMDHSARISNERLVKVLAAPVVAGITLEESDFLEILNLMKNDRFTGFTSMTRIMNVMASKACRGAVMIGEVLEKDKMRSIVDNLASLNKPWICAHGRPTVRLLHVDKR